MNVHRTTRRWWRAGPRLRSACRFPALSPIDEDADTGDAPSTDRLLEDGQARDAPDVDAPPGPFLLTFGSTGADTVRAKASSAGEIAIAGTAGGAMDIGGHVVGAGLYVAKTRPDGTVAWARTFVGGTAYRAVFITGYPNGTGSFGGPTVGSAGNPHVFFSRFDAAAGTHAWSRAYQAGVPSVGGYSLEVQGNTLRFGSSFPGQASFGGPPLAGPGGVIAAYDVTTGVHQSSELRGGEVVEWSVTPLGSVTVGTFSGTVTLGGKPRMSEGFSDVFVLRE